MHTPQLLKLGFKVAKRTVQKYMRQARRGLPPERKSQTWAMFLANHAHEIWACDFVQTYDLFFRTIFVFFMVELGSRRVVHFGVTRSPSDAWITQQLREATPFGDGPRFLICDNDGKFGDQFERVAEGSGIDVIHTPPYAPKANAICERFIGSVRRELLDHILILSERHLRRKVNEYVQYFNCARPHQGINGQIPILSSPPPLVVPPLSRLRRIPILGGLHHDYQWCQGPPERRSGPDNISSRHRRKYANRADWNRVRCPNSLLSGAPHNCGDVPQYAAVHNSDYATHPHQAQTQQGNPPTTSAGRNAQHLGAGIWYYRAAGVSDRAGPPEMTAQLPTLAAAQGLPRINYKVYNGMNSLGR